MGHGTHNKRGEKLQKGPGKVKRVLHASHEMLGHGLHHSRGDGDSAQGSAASHDEINNDSRQKSCGNCDPGQMESVAQMIADERQRNQASAKQSHGNADRLTMSAAAQKGRSEERAEASTHRPSEIQPAIPNGASMKNAITERRGDDALSEHASN